MPVAATRHTPDGAKTFAEFFIKTIDWGYATTSSTYMRHYFGKSCIGCLSTALAIDSATRAKHHFIGDRFTIRSDEIVYSSAAMLRVRITFDVTSGEVVNSKGEYVDGEPAFSRLREQITISWHTDHWLLDAFLAQK